MKRIFSITAALAVMVCLVTVLSGSALAASREISAVAGSEVSLELDVSTATDLTAVAVLEGELPPGLSLSVRSGRLLLTGTPSRTGDYRAVIHVDPSARTEEHTLRIHVRAEAQPLKAAGAGESAPVVRNAPPAQTQTTPEPTETPVPTLTPAPAGPWISKHPGGETVSAGGTALFVSRAEDAASIRWQIVAPQGAATYDPANISELFRDMLAVGYDTETLTLYNISGSFNNWQVECHFKDAQGNESVSGRATISVSTTLPEAPTILLAPEGAYLQPGQSTTLSVRAVAPEGNSIKYEWFSTETNDPATATIIADATGSTYTPPEKDGVVYYCVGLRSVNSETVSTRAYSPLVPVAYGVESPTPAHVHDFGDQWKSDDIYHWQVCECGERTAFSTHTYSWTVVKEPTARKDGERTGMCTVCGYQTTQAVPARQSERGRSKGLLVALLILVMAGLAVGTVWLLSKAGLLSSPKSRKTKNRRDFGRSPSHSRTSRSSSGRSRSDGPPRRRE